MLSGYCTLRLDVADRSDDRMDDAPPQLKRGTGEYLDGLNPS